MSTANLFCKVSAAGGRIAQLSQNPVVHGTGNTGCFRYLACFKIWWYISYDLILASPPIVKSHLSIISVKGCGLDLGTVCGCCILPHEVLFVAGKKTAERRQWFLLGKQVSPTCCMALLGMGNDRLNRVMQHRLDMRRSHGQDARLEWVCFSSPVFSACGWL